MIRAIFLTALAVIGTVASCRKDFKPDGTFLVTGIVMDSCGAPAVGLPLQVFTTVVRREKLQFDGLAGSGHTDSSGAFALTCDYYGDQVVMQVRVNGELLRVETFKSITLQERRRDLGIHYRSCYREARLTVLVQAPHTTRDTFFVASRKTGQVLAAITPIPDSSFTLPIRFDFPLYSSSDFDRIFWDYTGQERADLCWGIGRRQLLQAMKRGNDTTHLRFLWTEVTFPLCDVAKDEIRVAR